MVTDTYNYDNILGIILVVNLPKKILVDHEIRFLLMISEP